MTYACAYCEHPAEDHATGICLHTLECACPGYSRSEDRCEKQREAEQERDDATRPCV